MNTKQIQFTRQKAVVFLLAGLVLAAGLVWIQVNMNQASRGTDAVNTDAAGYESGLSPELHLNSVKGGKGGVNGGDVHK